MRVEITVTQDAGLQALFTRLAKLPEVLLGAVASGLKQAGPIIVGNAVKSRYTNQAGPFPIAQAKLGRKTGRLRQSISNTPPRILLGEGKVTMGFGSNADQPGVDAVKYFAFHEFGFSGSMPVRAHSRKNGQQVRAHSRQITYPGRAPMSTELRHPRTTDIILESVRRAAVKALEGGKLA